ncbi:hypothetical protein [Actinomadura decatromicini]|uniref:AAA+ ATPase domain-containing protein n=1 Tax=Actinomadura decatromicini TaxID=2604572 RepID=A0A5D3FZB2_9ACTN|nr:hypothetical protein [Actinomadura decatromicini]TYK52525.1 hypothetical protein FXF68_01760 [Actinomadura decatromicini]
MNETQPMDEPRPASRNPFPGVPEIHLTGVDAVVHVETDAVRAVRRLALDFLTSRPDVGGDLRNSGRVAAVVGDYGAGKSHLAWTLMDEVVRIAGTRPIVLVASARPRDTVLSVHRRLLAPPGSGTGGRIRQVDAAAGVLLFGTVERMVEDLCAGLRGGAADDPDAAPPAASDELSVDEVWALHERLTEIAGGDEELATVLGLVWHRSAGAAAWRWLCGDGRSTDEDAVLLADRGVRSPPVDDDLRALGVLRALARLCGRTGGRMVLVLDELHMMRPPGGDGLTETAATLMELLGWANEAGTLLVVCGLLDFWEALPESVRQRVTTRIVPSLLTRDQIRAYIAAAQGLDDVPGEAPHPFTAEAVEELWKITEGHPRRTITLCHHAHRLAAGTGRIGPRQIQEASRALCAPDTPDHVRSRLFGWCTELGYRVVRGGRGRWEPDLRVGSRQGDAECALVVSGPVVEDSELTALRDRGLTLAGRRPAHPRTVVLVMAGPLAAAFKDEIEDVFTHVLHWNSDGFRDELTATLRSYVPAGDDAGLYEAVMAMRRELRELGAAAPPALVATAQADPHAAEPRTWTDPDRRRRFAEAERLCARALEFIGHAHDRTHEFWKGRFHFDAKGVSLPRLAAPGDRHAALGDIVSRPVLQARGTLMFLEDAVGEFASRVEELLGDEARPLPQIREELRYLQRKLDHSVADVITMFPDAYEDERGTVARLLGVDRSTLNQHLAGLGATVYSAVVAPDRKDGT